MPVLGPLILVAIVAGIVIVIGFVLIIVPGLILLTIWSVAVPVVVIEKPPGLGALGRSRELVRGNGWQVFGVILILYFLVLVVSVALQATGNSAGTGVGIVVAVIVGVLTAPLPALAQSVLYFELLAARGERAPAPAAPADPRRTSRPRLWQPTLSARSAAPDASALGCRIAMTIDATALLRPGLLEGVTLAVAVGRARAGASAESRRGVRLGAAGALGADPPLGARCRERRAGGRGGRSARRWQPPRLARARSSSTRRACSAAQGGRDSLVALRWPRPGTPRGRRGRWRSFPPGAGGRILLLAPAGRRRARRAAAAGLENLARTLSIEWARYGITTVAIAPGAETPADELATLACYLLSPAGAYFSGCLLDLRGP